MTLPHPSAVGSYGQEAIEWAEQRSGKPLRWWQRLVLLRILEHDEAGALTCWPFVLFSTSRQSGKSWLLRELMLWRIHQSERFDEPQLVVHTAKDLPVCREVQRPARAWAHQQPHYVVREANGMEEIETPDGSRWIVRGKTSIYGYSREPRRRRRGVGRQPRGHRGRPGADDGGAVLLADRARVARRTALRPG